MSAPMVRMPYVLTLIGGQPAGAVTRALLARVTEAVDGAPPAILSPGEAADIPCPAAPDPAALRRRARRRPGRRRPHTRRKAAASAC